MRNLFFTFFALALLHFCSNAQADVFNMGTGITSLQTVTVGNPGNAADSTGYGSVNYVYNIGVYEVTSAQYCAFLNSVAATDTYGLYNTSMASGCGIIQSGNSGSYIYSVLSDSYNRPVNYVSFWDACRFANWVSNGQPIGTEEDTTNTGSYTLTSSAMHDNTVTRNADAKWCVTNEDEWYKAAYYDPNKFGGAGYWQYPTRSNSIDTGMSNYWNSIGYTTSVGSYPYSSAYGTYDQSGNLREWNESIVNGFARGGRGGSYRYNDVLNYRDYANPGMEAEIYGFRLSQVVPEPSSIIVLFSGLIFIAGAKKHKAK